MITYDQAANTRKSRHRRASGVVLGTALFITGFLTGCGVQVLDGENVENEATDASQPIMSELAILGVDFDPPLDLQALVSQQGVTLMVAVENRGAETQSDVQIIARLLDPDRSTGNDLLLEDRTVLAQIEPGEVVIARFKHLGRVPLRSRYMLQLEVEAPGEVATSSNGRTVEIIIVPE